MDNPVANEDITLAVEDDHSPIETIFVVSFNTKHGNTLEWNVSNEVNLNFLEFKALPSGAHNVEEDFVYFRQDELYGIACYAQIKVDSTEERGVRMKSIGVLGSTFASVFNYVDILPEYVRYLLNHPNEGYSRLEQLFISFGSADNKPCLPIGDGSSRLHRKSHPDGAFEQFVGIFGEQIMILWKLSLLDYRVLFLSQPPIGDVCYRVLSFSALSHHSHTNFPQSKQKPLFFVNIADIDELQKLDTYVACTSEKIFEQKKSLYDVFVDNWKIVLPTENNELKDLLKLSPSDKERYEELKKTLGSRVYSDDPILCDNDAVDAPLLSFFERLNNRLYAVLESSSRFETQLEISAELGPLCLDLQHDDTFLRCLTHKHNIRDDWLPAQKSSELCPTCSVM